MADVQFNKLFVIFPDRWSAAQIVADCHPHHFNPGGNFKEVHAVFMSEAALDAKEISRASGGATVHTYTFPLTAKFHAYPMKWRPFLKRRRAKRVLALARVVKPDLVRSFGTGIDLYIANKIRRRLKIPYMVDASKNIYDFHKSRIKTTSKKWKFWFHGRVQRVQEKLGLKQADAVICRSEGIKPYLRRLKVPNVTLVYDLLPTRRIHMKKNYKLVDDNARILCWSPQTAFLHPENIIRAVARIPYAHLDITGYGDHRQPLIDLVEKMGIGSRVSFLDGIPDNISGYDIFVGCSEAIEMQDPVAMAMLCGLPVVFNRRMGPPVPEYVPEAIKLTENTENGYYFSLLTLLEDDDLRENLGKEAAQFAAKRWHPDAVDAAITTAVKDVLGRAQNVRYVEFSPREQARL